MTSCSCENGISIYAGRDSIVRFTLTTSDPVPSTPYDLTGAKAWLSVKAETIDSDSDALILKKNSLAGGGDSEIKIIDAEGGVLEVYFDYGDTDGWGEGDYWFDLVVENSDEKRIQAVLPSRFRVKYTVTKIDIGD
jgi:hypothetical protein